MASLAEVYSMGELPKDLIALSEAARILGVTRVSAWRFAKAGVLTGHSVAGRILVSRREVERIARERRAAREGREV
jgi:predicted site-specific integrase-resolvase